MNLIRLLTLTFVAVSLLACQRKEVKQVVIKTTTHSPIVKTNNVVVKSDTPFLPNFPADTIYPARLLGTGGVYHEDEVDPKSAEYSWMGIFYTDSGYYIGSAKLQLAKDYDIVLDEEGGKKTGWTVTTNVKDSAILLVSGLNFLKSRKIDTVALAKNQLLPGQTEKFTYNGITYTLYATGNKKPEQPKSEYYTVSNYRLFVKATVNGQIIDQQLVYTNAFDDALTHIWFAGDIDGDEIPDFIIDTTNHYNVTATTLYLSKPAKKGDLLKVMGMLVTVGC